MPADPTCVFCRILAGNASASFVYRDELVSSFMALPQSGRGHVLIVPNEHYVNAYDLAPELAGPSLGLALRLARVIKRVLQTDGITLIQNSERGANQTVLHFHLHVLGRVAGQPIRLHDGTGLTDRTELDRLAELIGEGLREES